MATADRGPVIRLQGGPTDKWQYYEQDFLDCIRAAQRMHRRVGDPAGWPLCYERPVAGRVAGGEVLSPEPDRMTRAVHCGVLLGRRQPEGQIPEIPVKSVGGWWDRVVAWS